MTGPLKTYGVTNSGRETVTFIAGDYNLYSLLFLVVVSDKFCYRTDWQSDASRLPFVISP
jgi:hypothetical protein